MRTQTRVAWIVVGAVALTACRSTLLPAALERHVQAQRLAGDLALRLTRSADAANRAVMAESDEASASFARESEQAAGRVERGAEALKPLLEGLGYRTELNLLAEFTERFARYRALDREILSLAVENSNLKAQRLSFGQGQTEADAVRDALRRDTEASVPSRALAAAALADMREVQVFQARHIAEAGDAEMTRMEGQMAAAAASARRELGLLSNPGATAAFERFMAVNAEILSLSRRNSDVRSLAMSLGEKRMAAATCEEALDALQAALDAHGFGGTR